MRRGVLPFAFGVSCFAFVAGLGLLAPAHAELVYQEVGGVVVGEAEVYTSRTNAASGKGWLVVPGESAGAGAITNARGGSYIQSLPDNNGSEAGPAVPPSISYKMRIFTPGTYRLFLREEANMSFNTGGSSDSMYADIVELKDGTAGVFGSATNAIADWYEFTPGVDGDFATTPWYTTAQPEVNQASAGGYTADWTIKREGVYTLRLSVREDGSAVDAWVFQLNSLPAPTGFGPVVSSLVPSRALITAAGDTFLKRNETTIPHGTNTELVLKNENGTAPADLDRAIYLRFDLSPLAAFKGMILTNASLRIDQISEGTGTNHEIYVAAISESASAEKFDESSLTPSTSDVWSSSTDEAVNFDKIIGNAPLGSFTIASSNNNKTVTFDGAALRDAIRADTNSVLSLVLYRTFDHTSTDTFASKEHATLNPPRLVLSFRDEVPGTVITFR